MAWLQDADRPALSVTWPLRPGYRSSSECDRDLAGSRQSSTKSASLRRMRPRPLALALPARDNLSSGLQSLQHRFGERLALPFCRADKLHGGPTLSAELLRPLLAEGPLLDRHVRTPLTPPVASNHTHVIRRVRHVGRSKAFTMQHRRPSSQRDKPHPGVHCGRSATCSRRDGR